MNQSQDDAAQWMLDNLAGKFPSPPEMIRFELFIGYVGDPPEEYEDDDWLELFKDLRATFPGMISQDVGLRVASEGYVHWHTIKEDLEQFSLKYPQWMITLSIISKTVFMRGESEQIKNDDDYNRWQAIYMWGLDETNN